jgi:DNA polymerase III epsilon subunit-like protein
VFNGKTVDTFQTLVDPEVPIPAEVSAINRITDDMVRGGEK